MSAYFSAGYESMENLNVVSTCAAAPHDTISGMRRKVRAARGVSSTNQKIESTKTYNS